MLMTVTRAETKPKLSDQVIARMLGTSSAIFFGSFWHERMKRMSAPTVCVLPIMSVESKLISTVADLRPTNFWKRIETVLRRPSPTAKDFQEVVFTEWELL